MEAVSAVLVDIEGTTSSISFVHDVLFPYARRALPDFVRAHAADPEVERPLAAVAAEADLEPTDTEGLIETLLAWIDADRKVTALKDLQGMIWEAGYRDGAFRAHVYPDAVDALSAWHSRGLALYVYSSGSIRAQKLFFGHSEAGDLCGLFAGHFDTTSGAKRDPESYRNIIHAIGHAPAMVVFLSDIPEELDAARSAGLQTVWVIREEEGRYRRSDGEGSAHQVVGRLTDVHLEPAFG